PREKVAEIVHRASQEATAQPLPGPAVGTSLDQVLRDHKIGDDRLRSYPANIIYFGKVLTEFGSLCDRNSDATVKSWGGDWKSGRRLMVVTVISAGAAGGLVEKGVLALANEKEKTLPVLKCVRATFGDSKVEHYVLAATDVTDVSYRSRVE